MDELLSWIREGAQLRQVGRYADAEQVLRSALSRAVAVDPDSDAAGSAASELAFVYQDLGRYRDAESLYETALRIADLHRDQVAALTVVTNLATLCTEAGQHAQVERLDIAGRIQQAGSGLQVAHARTALGADAMRRSRFNEARVLFAEALLTFEAEGQGEDVAVARCNLGTAMAWTGRSAEGIEMVERCVSFLEANSPRLVFLKSLANLSVLYGYAGRGPAASATAERAATGVAALLGKEGLSTAAIFLQCSYAMHAAGNKREAKRLRQEAEGIRRALHADMQVDVSSLLPGPKPRR